MKFYEKAILVGLTALATLSSCKKFETIGTDFYNGQKVELQEKNNGKQKKLIIYKEKKGAKTEIFESNAYVYGKDSFNIGDSRRDHVKEYIGGIMTGYNAGPIHTKYTNNSIQYPTGNKDHSGSPSIKEKIDAKMSEANNLSNKILENCDFK